MKKSVAERVTISMVSTFRIRMAPPDIHKIQYEGQLYATGDGWYIKFVEPGEEGTTNTTLKMKEDEITVIRHGAVTMRHSYRKGVKTAGSYIGPAGAMHMETDTRDVRYKNDEQGWLSSCAWSYDLYLNEQKIGRYELECSIAREVNKILH
nr:DUF1934 domain-containing protein [Aneurinibacillus terranovensis]